MPKATVDTDTLRTHLAMSQHMRDHGHRPAAEAWDAALLARLERQDR